VDDARASTWDKDGDGGGTRRVPNGRDGSTRPEARLVFCFYVRRTVIACRLANAQSIRYAGGARRRRRRRPIDRPTEGRTGGDVRFALARRLAPSRPRSLDDDDDEEDDEEDEDEGGDEDEDAMI